MADRVAATGILLVGGASERFGSPKALALFRGESLAERGWRTLREVCAEVLAVGKADDGSDLPFELVDDGTDERAPVFGVIAGLSAAAYETCIFLPVDCPLVTPDLLRDLLGAGAVPQTGPLPGVYTRTMLAELEARVAVGERSLRGVNLTVLQVDESRVFDVDTPTDLVVAASVAFDDAADERPVLPPDDDALRELSFDFWATALWAGRSLRRGDVFVAVDAVNGAMKRSVVTLLGWHAKAVDPDAPVLEDGRQVERWADAGALSALELAYAHYELRDAARALWQTIDLFQGLEEETASRLGLSTELDHADLRRRVAEVVRDPRPGRTLWP